MNHLPVLLPLLYFLGALLMPWLGGKRSGGAVWLAQATTAVVTVLAGLALYSTLQHGTIRYSVGGWSPPVGIELVMDPLSAFVALVISAVASLVLVHGRLLTAAELPQKSMAFYSMVLILMGGLTGMVITGDLFNLYVFLEISALASYALVALGDQRAPVAAFRYLILGSVGAAFYLLGLGFLFIRTGSLNMADVTSILSQLPADHAALIGLIFMVVGIGLKMALFPLHGWLPDAYTFAHSTVTALIAPIGTKVAAYVLLRLLNQIFAEKLTAANFPMGRVVLYLGAGGILWGSMMALTQKNFKRMLAYSSIGQIGYIAAGIGLGSALGFVGAVLHLMNHAVMKACLFLVSANLRSRLGHEEIDRLDASTHRIMPWTCAALVLAALSMIGLPPTAGFFSKWYLVLGAVEQNQWVVASVILLSSLMTAVYFWRVIERVYLRANSAGPEEAKIFSANEVAPTMLTPTLLLSASLLVLGLGNAFIVQNVIQRMIESKV